MIKKKTIGKKLVNQAVSKPGKALAEKLESNVVKIVEIEKSQKKNRTAGEKISVLIAEFLRKHDLCLGSRDLVWSVGPSQ